MPRKPLPPQPRPVTRASETFGSPVRVGILGALARDGELTPGAVATTLGLDRATVRENLRALEALGAVHGTPPACERAPGRIVVYRLKERRVVELLDHLRKYVSQPPGPAARPADRGCYSDQMAGDCGEGAGASPR